MARDCNNGIYTKRRRLEPHENNEDNQDDRDDATENVMGYRRSMSERQEGDLNKVSHNINTKYGIGARLLSKMGYVEGQGLGKNRSGIAEPIQAEQRSMPNAGLGMLSALTIDEEEYGDSESSSDDEKHISPLQNGVSFNKTTTEDLSRNALDDRDREIEKLVHDLKSQVSLDLKPEKIDLLRANVTEEGHKLKIMMKEVVDIQQSLKAINHRITVLEPEVTDIQDEEQLLNDINNRWKEKSGDSLNLDTADLILKLSDIEMVDQLMSDLLRKAFTGLSWDPLDVSNEVLTQLVPLVDILKYRMDSNSDSLNRTQTIVFKIVFSNLLQYWQNFSLNLEKVNTVITLLMDYEPILKFVNSFVYIKKQFINPKLIEALNSWEISNSESYPPRLWLFDFMVIIDEDIGHELRDIVDDKFTRYCKNWDHRKSICIAKPDNLFLREILGDRYLVIVNTIFLSKFIDQLWDNHFDPIIELGNWKSVSHDEGTFYYLAKLQEYKEMFDESEYKVLLKGVFNEFNKILHQWMLYASLDDRKKARWWLNSMINVMFSASTPIEMELTEIRSCYNFLNDPKSSPIHDESFDLKEELHVEEPQKINDELYTFHNIPLRKVTPTFKDILLDYCEEKGYALEKLHDKYTVIPHGGQKDSLVPVFKMKRGNDNHFLAIKDDILWLKRSDGKFAPAYLYDIR